MMYLESENARLDATPVTLLPDSDWAKLVSDEEGEDWGVRWALSFRGSSTERFAAKGAPRTLPSALLGCEFCNQIAQCPPETGWQAPDRAYELQHFWIFRS
jgi:hypothetical protein